MANEFTYPVGIFGDPQSREESVIGDAIGGQTIVSHVLKKLERLGALSGASARTNGCRVGDLVGPTFRATGFHGFDQFAGLLPTPLGATAIDGRRVTKAIGFDSVCIHLLQEAKCLGPQFFVIIDGSFGTFGRRGRR